MTKRRALLLAGLALLVSGAAVALGQPPHLDPTRDQPGGGASAPPRELTPADRERRARVVAKVRAVEITLGEVEDAINEQSPFLRGRYVGDSARLHEFVEQMVRFELLAAEAERRGLGTHPDVVRSVKQNSVQALIRREFDERITPESMPADDVRAYYEANAAEFSRPEMVRASHILVADRARAEQLLGELREADARAFRNAAREHSIDTETKLRGGDLRYFDAEGRAFNTRDAAVDAAIAAAAFGLREVGDLVAAPVPVAESFSIIKLTGRRPAEHRTIEEAEQGIRLRLWRERRQGAVEEFVRDLRERVRPEVHEDRMEAIRLDTTPTEDDAQGFPPHGPGPGAGGSDPSGAPLPDPTAPPAKAPASPGPAR